MEFIPVMQSWIFSIITPVSSVTDVYADVLILLANMQMSMLKTIVRLKYFVETVMQFPPRILWWIESSKEQHLFEI